MRSVNFYVAYLIRKAWTVLALGLVIVAVALSLLRFSLPYLDQQKQILEDYLSEQFGSQLTIGSISAEWQGLGPAVVLHDIQLVQNPQSPIQLDIAETIIEVDFWGSVLDGQIKSNKFDLQSLHVVINLQSLRQDDSDYPLVDALERLFLQQLQSFSISNSSILLLTANDQQTVVIEQVSWVNEGERHQGQGRLQIKEIARNSASFVLDLHGLDDDLSGTFFAKGEELELAPWLNQWLHTSYELTESRGSFVMWASIANKSLSSVQLDLSNSRFSWQQGKQTISAEVLGGQINAAPQQGRWIANLDNLSLMINDQLSVSSWMAQRQPDGEVTLSNVNSFEISPYMALLPLFSTAQSQEWLAKLQPQGNLHSLQLAIQNTGLVDLHASLGQLNWQQLQAVPGMSEVNAELWWSGSQGKIDIASEVNRLQVSANLPQDLDYQALNASVYLHVAEQGLEISSDTINLNANEISVRPQFYYRSSDQFLSLSANIDAMQVADLAHFYPADLMGEDTKNYLSKALVSGTVTSAQLLWHGKLSDFPYQHNQGVFQAAVALENSALKFDSHWPALQELNINLLFENQGLWMRSNKGRLLDVELAELQAKIPSLSHGAVLTIDTIGHGSGQQVRDLMDNSNLADSLGSALHQVKIDGQLQTSLNLHIPLSAPDVVATGKVQLAGNSIDIVSMDMRFTEAHGEVSFVNDKVSFTQVQAQLLEQPVLLDFNGHLAQQDYQAAIHIQGDWQLGPLAEQLNPRLNEFLSGHSQWQLDVDLTLPAEGFEYTAILRSELVGMQATFPAPFAKQAEQSRSLVVEAKGNKQASTVNVKLGDNVEFNGNLPHETMEFSRAHLAVGETDLIGMGLGFSVSANVLNVDGDAWYYTIDHLLSAPPTTHTAVNNPMLSAPKRIYISAANADMAGQKLTNLELVAKNTNDSWLLDINAREARMEVALYKDWLGQGVNINADFIELATQSLSEEAGSQSEAFVPKPDTIPPINFSCKRCRLFNLELGKVDFSLSRAASGMHIDNIRLNNRHGVVFAQGDWFFNGSGESSTRLTGEFNSSDFGALLKDFQFNSGIKDSKANARFDLSWQQAPYEFNFATLNGDMDWRLSDGYLTEVTDKGSRIFSILSLDSLVRKLKLDFRDVFAKGFFYDRMKGSFQIQNGIVDTRDTAVDGGAGDISMVGFTDLNSQQLNYQISFVPKVTSSLPVIVAWMVNPATALAALALDQVLTSAKVISNIKFSLTGTFDQPVIEELGRDSKEITLPAKVPVEATPPAVDGSHVDSPIGLPKVQQEVPLSG